MLLAYQNGWGFSERLDIGSVLEYAKLCEGGIGFLLDNGFIEKKGYYVGQYFKYGTNYYLLAKVDSNPFVCLINFFTSTSVANPRLVSDPNSITEVEFDKIADESPQRFKSVKVKISEI